MATDAEMMLFAMSAYDREEANTAPVPQGWDPLPLQVINSASGFSAAAFRNPMTGEVVIAYAGTDADLTRCSLAGNQQLGACRGRQVKAKR